MGNQGVFCVLESDWNGVYGGPENALHMRDSRLVLITQEHLWITIPGTSRDASARSIWGAPFCILDPAFCPSPLSYSAPATLLFLLEHFKHYHLKPCSHSSSAWDSPPSPPPGLTLSESLLTTPL